MEERLCMPVAQRAPKNQVRTRDTMRAILLARTVTNGTAQLTRTLLYYVHGAGSAGPVTGTTHGHLRIAANPEEIIDRPKSRP